MDNLKEITVPSEVDKLFDVSYNLLFNVSLNLLKKDKKFSKLENHQFLNLLLHNLKQRSNINFELESERDDLEGNNSITLTFNDSKDVPFEEPIEEKDDEKVVTKKQKSKSPKIKETGESEDNSITKEKSDGKRGRPKMGKTIWKDIIIKSDQEWQEANSFIKNFIDEYDEKYDTDQNESFKDEQIELLKKYELNIISKIYRMIESSDYIELLKNLYKKNESVLNDLQNEKIYIKFILELLNQEIKTEENKGNLENLIKENIPSELALVK